MRLWRAGAVLALLAGCLGTALADDRFAPENPAGTRVHVRARQTWYAFVGEGERLRVFFTKVVNAVGTPFQDLVVTVRGPAG